MSDETLRKSSNTYQERKNEKTMDEQQRNQSLAVAPISSIGQSYRGVS